MQLQTIDAFSRSKDHQLSKPMKSRNTREAVSVENIDQSLFEYREFPHVPTSVTLLKESHYKNSASLFRRKKESKSVATCNSDKSSTFKTFGSISSRKAD